MPKIKKDINPNATALSRIPLRKIPGPMDYNTDISFMSAQTSFVDTSKSENRGCRFGNSERRVFDAGKDFTPGPGNYQASSAFGHYIDQRAVPTLFSHSSINS